MSNSHSDSYDSNNKPNFYAIIPADVRYCKNLEPSAKLLYGEITALSNRDGYCWASNKYFADAYEVDERTVKNWLQSLKENGFIEVEVEKNGFQTNRKIWIIQNKFTKGNNIPPDGKESSPRGEKNAPHNNTYNNTQITSKEDIAQTAERPSYDIGFDFDKNKFSGVEKRDLDSWKELYPTVDIVLELKRMREWIMSNPTKNKTKKKWRTFINNWLRSTNDKNINKEAYSGAKAKPIIKEELGKKKVKFKPNGERYEE